MSAPVARTGRLREGLLALGFVLLVAAAGYTVAWPELTKEPEAAGARAGRTETEATGAGRTGTAGTGATPAAK